jgi:proline dehydrogenase
MMRTLLARVSENAWMRTHVPNFLFVRRAVRRFVPGEDLAAALTAVHGLKQLGIDGILTQLGESVTEPGAADAVAAHYLEVLAGAAAHGVDGQPSIKPTQLGLDLPDGLEHCCRNLTTIVARAAGLGNYVWIDMEASKYVDQTLELFRRVHRLHPNVGICLQTCLYRTEADLAGLVPLGAGIRLVKGAYKEPPSRAFPNKRDVDRNYLALSRQLLAKQTREHGSWPAFGTHDRRLIEALNRMAADEGVAKNGYEFQMLYGIQRNEQERLAREGYRVRVMVNYGSHWFPWYMRRLAERPANLWFVARSVFVR